MIDDRQNALDGLSQIASCSFGMHFLWWQEEDRCIRYSVSHYISVSDTVRMI